LATYAYLSDVIVHEDCRGRGFGSWMIEAILEHPDLQRLRRIALFTRDARELYERYGFAEGSTSTSVYMERRPGV
jgi:ribosomal protein S18 acetylase RimI-like enzyme